MKVVDHVCSVFLRQILLRMKELGISQTELANRMKVSRPYITKVLRQDVNFSFRTAAKLARALQMDFSPELHPLHDPCDKRGCLHGHVGYRTFASGVRNSCLEMV